jgi:cytochrome oxidase Cu insertion factor (SCO1/SenC/PrrC family)
MPGMNSGLSDTNPTLVAAFRAALLHQGLTGLLVLAVLALGWAAAREFLPGARTRAPGRAARPAEPAARRLLRIGFGIIWIFDGLLQAQPAMAAGLPSRVIEPTAASSPDWVQQVVNWAGTTWSFHPVQAGAAAVWIQLGLGAWLIAAPDGWSSRLAGLSSAGWGLVVWVFGEAFGGIFAPGLTFLFGAPGAVLFYCAAGALIAVPAARWRAPRFGRLMLAGLGAFLAGMAVLQAWPGRGFWQGTLHRAPGTLVVMARSMAATPQPRFLAAAVRWFAAADAAHGFAVNLAAVIVLAVIAAGLLAGRPKLVRPALILLLALCLADWVLIEDLGFFGGLGTDPNSMIPVALLAVSGYLALSQASPAEVAEPAGVGRPAGDAGPAHEARPGPRRAAVRVATAFGAVSSRALVAAWAVFVLILGAAPLAMAQATGNADPIIAQAIDGNSAPLDFAAPGFALTDQAGHEVSLASLRGKVVLLTFLDPVCTSDCPLIAQEFREAGRLLGGQSRRVELVAIVANPVYRTIAYTRAFDSQEGLAGVRNWLFLTGPLRQLQAAWQSYDIAAQVLPAGGMVAHNDVAYVIDAAGHTRSELDFDPGPGTTSSVSSFAAELADAARQYLRPSS